MCIFSFTWGLLKRKKIIGPSFFSSSWHPQEINGTKHVMGHKQWHWHAKVIIFAYKYNNTYLLFKLNKIKTFYWSFLFSNILEENLLFSASCFNKNFILKQVFIKTKQKNCTTHSSLDYKFIPFCHVMWSYYLLF